jgi:hypothetical protein
MTLPGDVILTFRDAFAVARLQSCPIDPASILLAMQAQQSPKGATFSG